MRAPVGTIVLLVVAVVLYAGMMSCFVDAPNSDAFGRGLALAYGAFLGGGLWLVLAAILIVAAAKGRMPLTARIVAVILWPLSCVAVWMAGDAYAARDSSAIWVPALLPLLIALYAVWARFPSLHTVFRAGSTSAVLGGAIAFLTLAPLVAATRAALPDPAREARLEAAGKANEERIANEARQAREREEGQFASLGPHSNVGDYLIYLSSMTYAERALAGIRQVKNRQGDAISLLQRGRIGDLRELSQFNIEPTAELCSLWRGVGRRRQHRHQGAHGLSYDCDGSRTAAAQLEVADRQSVRPRSVARPSRDQRARRCRFRPHDRVRRKAGGTAPS